VPVPEAPQDPAQREPELSDVAAHAITVIIE
jgi:hypothetical protein